MDVDVDADAFSKDGFLVLRDVFDAAALSLEVKRTLEHASAIAFDARVESGSIDVTYAPMMNAQTPQSLDLLDALEDVARRLVGGAVLPTRAKAVRYARSTPWHTDTSRRVASVGFAAYLEPLTGATGALRVVPGSHRRDAALHKNPGDGLALPTSPGDIIAFDEHLLHASVGGAVRHQWRVDFVRDPVGDDETAEVVAYFGDIFPSDGRCPYDAARFPSYGAAWRHSGRSCVTRLEQFGVYEMASRVERAA